jgi:hypothetical protein
LNVSYCHYSCETFSRCRSAPNFILSQNCRNFKVFAPFVVCVCVSVQHNKWQTAAVIALADDQLAAYMKYEQQRKRLSFIPTEMTCMGPVDEKIWSEQQKSVTIHRNTLIFVCVIFSCVCERNSTREGAGKFFRFLPLFSFHPIPA